MPADGGLRAIFRQHLLRAQWSSVETGATGGGVPDAEYCFPGGRQGWVEFKAARGGPGRLVTVRPGQVAWHARRARLGGASFFATRRVAVASARRDSSDELWLVPGREGETLMRRGLGPWFETSWSWPGGPASWDWAAVEAVLTGGSR